MNYILYKVYILFITRFLDYEELNFNYKIFSISLISNSHINLYFKLNKRTYIT
jgi:hypothetical protein